MSTKKTSIRVLAQRRAAVAIDFFFENSLFLLLGAVAGLVWANVDLASYLKWTNGEFVVGDTPHVRGAVERLLGLTEEATHGFGHVLHFAVNDIGMAFFFAIAAKEVWEAMLPGGDLSSFKTAGAPLLATAGGMVGPAGFYVAGCYLFDEAALLNGWAIPMATDIAFSFMLARIIFGPRHPAIPFLLLLAIADDAAGLIVIAAFFPQEGTPHYLLGLALVVGAVVIALFLNKRLRKQNFWWYMLPGALSWLGFHEAAIHPALGLVPIIPCMPHAATDLGVFAEDEAHRTDTLNQFEHWWKRPVEIFLGLFGLCNAGVELSGVGTGTWLVVVGLLVGKPLGIVLFVKVFAQRLLGLSLPKGMSTKDLIVVGMAAGIGFTVALFVSTVAFVRADQVALLAEVKMGALLSFGAAFLTFATAKALGIKPLEPDALPPADPDAAGTDAPADPKEAADAAA